MSNLVNLPGRGRGSRDRKYDECCHKHVCANKTVIPVPDQTILSGRDGRVRDQETPLRSESKDAKGEEEEEGLKCWNEAEGSNRKEDEENPGRRAARRDTRVVQGNAEEAGGLPAEAGASGWGEGGGRRHIYLTCDATAPEFH